MENNKTQPAVCSNLEIKDEYSQSTNTLKDLYGLQKDIQENVYGYNFKEMQEGPLSNLAKFIFWNVQAQHSEIQEGLDALGGIKNGIGAGIWKPWKKTHKEAVNMTFNDMSDSDKVELKMEYIDELHFLFNKMLAVGMTTEELFNYYFAKNEENRNRQKRGY